MNTLMEKIAKEVLAMVRLDNEAKADMLSELVTESAKLGSDPVRCLWPDEHKEKHLWSCLWGVKNNHRRLDKVVDVPREKVGTPDGEIVVLDLDVSWDECDRGRCDVMESVGIEDVWTDLGRVVTDALDSKIIGCKSEGFGNRETSEMLGVSEKTVWMRLEGMKKRLALIDRVTYARY